MTDADRLEIMATDLEAENKALKAERDEAIRERDAIYECSTKWREAAWRHMNEIKALTAENASLREQGRAAEAERDLSRGAVERLIAKVKAISMATMDPFESWHRFALRLRAMATEAANGSLAPPTAVPPTTTPKDTPCVTS